MSLLNPLTHQAIQGEKRNQCHTKLVHKIGIQRQLKHDKLATQNSVSFSYQKTSSRCGIHFPHELTCQILTNQGIKIDKERDQRVTMVKKSKATACKSRLNFRVRGQFEIKILIVQLMNITKSHNKQQIISKKYSNSVGRCLSPRYGQVF